MTDTKVMTDEERFTEWEASPTFTPDESRILEARGWSTTAHRALGLFTGIRLERARVAGIADRIEALEVHRFVDVRETRFLDRDAVLELLKELRRG